MRRLIFVSFFLSSLVMAFGQSSTGTIAGTVTDQTGAVLPGVQISVTNKGTSLNRAVITNERGDYVVPLLPVGAYELSAELPGFKTQVRQGITLQVDQRLKADFALQVGEITERLVVSEAAPLVNSETSSIGNVIENRRVVELPLNGREFQKLTMLVPGAMPPTPGSIETSYGSITMAGARETSTAFTLDGMDMADGLVSRPAFKPSIDMIQEFKVQSSTYSAELGRSAGGHVTVTTKSGTNELHGTLYEFLRNDKLDAKNFFDSPNERIPGFKRNNFGGAIGGPIVRDRTFFFGNYEGLRLRQALTRTATVPSTAMINGDFSAVKTPILDPVTGVPFPGNIIPANRISKVGQSIARFYPVPNLPGAVRNYVSSPTDRKRVDQFTFKVDHRFSDKDNFSARYTLTDDHELDPFDAYQGITNLPGYGRQDNQRAHSISMSETRVFSAKAVGEFRLGFNRYGQLRAQENRADIPGQIGIPGTTKNPFNTGFPAFRITGFDTIGKATAFPSDRKDNTYQANANITYTVSDHTIKLGGEVARFNSNNLQNGGQQGDFSFTGQYTNNGLSDVLLGLPKQAGISRGDTENPIYRNTFAAFLQDDWKLTKRLTLNLGVRYDLLTPIVSASNRLSRFDPQTGVIEIAGASGVRRDISRPDLNLGGADYNADIARLATTIKMVDLGTRNVYRQDRNDFAPRVGLAYRMLDNDRLVVRTGYGIFYNMLYLNTGGLGIGRNFPFKVSQVFNSTTPQPNITIENPFPPGLGGATISPVSIRKDFRTGYVHQYNFGFQYQPRQDMVVDISFVGSKSTKLDRSVNLNQPLPQATGSVASRRPYPAFGNISYTEPAANATFNSLQGRVERRYSSGLTLLGAYTWSKSIDTNSGQNGSGDNNTPQDHRNIDAGMRGLSNFDARHRLVLSYIYELPAGPGKRFLGTSTGFGSWLVAGWQLSGITQLQTGRPLTVNSSADISNTGNTPNDRPNLIGDPKLPRDQRTPDHWFNTAAFATPARGTFGNVGRNTVTAPGISNWDFSLTKNNRVESKNVQFRAEVFNLANHPQFDMPNRDSQSPQFGRIFATSQFSRQVQLGLKVIY